MTPDRRTFLRRAAALCGLATPLAATACRMGDDDRGGSDLIGGADHGIDPTLAPGPGTAVRLTSTDSVRPVAYLSRSRRRVWVERSLRDRIHRMLGAHISVSTGLWRIPLPGDDPRVPIPPGDEEREYLEVGMERWDPAMEPDPGDVRILRGEPVTVRVASGCVPVPGDEGGGVVAVPPFRLGSARAGGAGLVREDFAPVARGRRHRDPTCRGDGEPVEVLGWSAEPEPR